MTKLVKKIEYWVSYSGYVIICILVFLMGLFAWFVDDTVVKLIIGVSFVLGFAGTLAVTISSGPKRIPFLAAAMILAVWAMASELYRDNAEKSHIFYIAAYVCLVVGLGTRTYDQWKKRKEGPPRPPNP